MLARAADRPNDQPSRRRQVHWYLVDGSFVTTLTIIIKMQAMAGISICNAQLLSHSRASADTSTNSIEYLAALQLRTTQPRPTSQLQVHTAKQYVIELVDLEAGPICILIAPKKLGFGMLSLSAERSFSGASSKFGRSLQWFRYAT